VELLLFLAGALVLGWYAWHRRTHSGNYKIDSDMLIVKDDMNHINIPLKDIVEVTRIGKTKKQSSWLNIDALAGKEENVAIFTRSNISYLVKMKNARTLMRELKGRNRRVSTKAEVI